jgi:phospholipase/carboxylesterase
MIGMKLVETDDALYLEPERPARSAVVWLHGAGTDARVFLSFAKHLPLSPSLAVRWVFPQAPVRAIEMYGGTRLRAWCNFRNMTRTEDQDAAGVRESGQRIDGYIRAQHAAGIPSERMVIGGFSQGGAMALHVGLRVAEPLAGIIGLSCYLPIYPTVPTERSAAAIGTPILMCHGSIDTVLPMQMGSLARDYLGALGYPVEWHEYAMQHELCSEEIEAIGQWLEQQLG